MRAAKYLGVAPWELATKSVAWRNWALMIESAEIRAENEERKRHEAANK